MPQTVMGQGKASSRRTPSPHDEGLLSMEDDYSPTPGADMMSDISPGSASDHMGGFGAPPQKKNAPFFPGSSALAAFDSNQENHRLISTNLQQQQQQHEVEEGENTGNRRHKRLERNRESARLSRRRRKQYLEQLEERVNKMGQDLDRSRREHVAQAIPIMHQKRVEAILQGSPHMLPVLEDNLSRTNTELMVTTTFQKQQLVGFALPPSMQFILWLTLQTDTFFRGGRATSERLSAARIGERILSSGTNFASPNQSMWPLFCNEIGLSYDQEERVRQLQRQLLQEHSTWVDRHTAVATEKVVQSAHDAVQALTLRAGQREQITTTILSEVQRMNLMSWSTRNRDRVAKIQRPSVQYGRELSNEQHVAANLYITNERLESVFTTIPRAAPLVTGAKLKRLSRRAAFESLGAADEKLGGLSSKDSCGSLKRNASEMSMEGEEEDKPQVPSISPVDAQASATPAIERALGFIRDLVPPPPPVAATFSTFSPSPTIPARSFAYQAPVAMTQSAPQFGALVQPASMHNRKSSFLPDYLNVVPEEMWPAGEEETEEMLLGMIEGDWAIGFGIDMEPQE